MSNGIVIPAQIRAGRALLEWSQEQLAKEAEVGLSTVRDIESEKRAADTGAVASIRRALWNGGVVFVAGNSEQGAGVRLVTNWPNIIRRPTTMQKWEGMPVNVEWQGKSFGVLVSREVLDDLDGHSGNTSDEVYLKTFDRHRGRILSAIALAITDQENFDSYGRLCIRQKDIDAAEAGQWYRVAIDSAEDIREMEATGLMRKFVKIFINTGLPKNVEVYRDVNIQDSYVYFFSPVAAIIARDLLKLFSATPCATKPELSRLRKVQI